MDPEYERRQLRKIERWFEVTDPRLATTLAGPGASVRTANRRSVRFAVDAAGLTFVVAGTAVALPLVFVGCLLLMTGACMHTTCRRR